MPKDNSDIHEELENSAFDEKEANLFDLYAEDPERADLEVFGRESNSNRRGFLKGAGLATIGALSV